MRPYSRDLTIESVLEDPMIRAAMRADRVDARDFETLLRSAASPSRRQGARHRHHHRRSGSREPARPPSASATPDRVLHPASDLRLGHRYHHGAGRVDRLCAAARLASSGHHSAAGGGQRHLSGRQRAGRGRHGDDAARTADQRRRGHDLHVVVELERRLRQHHRDLRGRLPARHRGRRRAEPRLAGRLLAAGHRQPGRRDDQEAEPELRSHRQPDLAGRLDRSRGAEQLRLPPGRRSAQAPAGRRRRADLRRAALFDARSGSIPTSSPTSASRRPTCRAPSPSRTCRWPPARSASRRRPPARLSKCRSMPSAASATRPNSARSWCGPTPPTARSCACAMSPASSSGRCNTPRSAFFGNDPTVVLAVYQRRARTPWRCSSTSRTRWTSSEALPQGHRLRDALRHDALRLGLHARRGDHPARGAGARRGSWSSSSCRAGARPSSRPSPFPCRWWRPWP